MRFTQARVRQIGEVENCFASFNYYRGNKTIRGGFPLSGDPEIDDARSGQALGDARRSLPLLPDDPFQTKPESKECSREEFPGKLIAPEGIPKAILEPAEGMDFVGIFMQGPVCRGAANSLGGRHWFATETFAVDYSAYLSNGKAVKSSFAGRDWDDAAYRSRLAEIKPQLEALQKSEKVLSPGKYRVYISPVALVEVIPFFSWNGLSERSIREGESSYLALREGRKSFSPKFSLTQDFSLGMEPRFNDLGELAPERLPIIEGGKLVNTLVSARSAKQYGVPSNAAPEFEDLRSAAIGAGDLDETKKLEALGTGLYVSNFHYLNWSDTDTARVTGMTRFACFWVENGKIVAPIKDMRFDETLYSLFGEKLLGLTKQRIPIVATDSYYQRALGGSLLPGLLVEDFPFTL
jgi:hypothetical protein